MSNIIFLVFSTFILLLIYANTTLTQVLLEKENFSTKRAQFGFENFYTGSRNFVEISYGIGNLNHKKISTEFSSLAMSEIKLGRRFLKPVAGYKIIEFNDNYLFSSFVDSYNSNGSSESLKINYDIWRFGLGYRKGYGYNLSGIGILAYNHLGLVWNRSQLTHPYNEIRVFKGSDYDDEIEIIEFYDEEIKFGTSTIGGIDLRLGSLISIGASYETAVIFPYHKFWKQVGSFFIEIFAQTGIDYLTEGVLLEQVPRITPILYFVLKNGLSYYLFTEKQKEMNWPFETVAPVTLEVVKFNIKISF